MVATWTGAVSNDWNNGANWSTGVVPGAGDAIVIPASASVSNEPSILDNDTATVSGDIEDNGVITLASTGDRTDLIINGGVTLSGSGSLTLTDSSANQIYSNQGGSILTNEATIQGAGEITANSNLSIVNASDAVIDASQKNNVLNINNITVTNNGLVESTGAAGLYLQSMTLNQTDGGVLEANGGPININSSVNIIAGKIADGPNGGLIHSSGVSSLLDGSAANGPLTIASKTIVQIDDDANLSLAGSIVNDGELSLASGGDNTDLIVGSGATGGTVTLSGGGTVQLGDNNANRIYSNTGSTTLDNVDDTIQGAGQIYSNGNLGIFNEAKGVIDGTSSTSGNELRLTSIGITNEGLLEGTGAGGLELDNMTLNQAGGGVLEADDGVVTIGGGTDIVGGALTSANGGTLQSDASGGVLDGTGLAVTITAGATLKIDDNGSIALASNGTTGSIVNKGEILLDANTDTTILIVGSGATGGTVALSGGGTLQLTDSDANEIYSNTGSTTLDNIDNKIQGAGVIESNGNLGVTNEADGIIDGTSSTVGHDLRLTGIGITNKGLVEGTGSGGLELDNMTLTQTNGGVLEANGGAVTIGSYTHIIGGALTSVDGGALQSDGSGALLDGTTAPITISSATDLQIDDKDNLALATNGDLVSFNNDGEISLASTGDLTNLIVGSGATGGTLSLTGGGTVQLGDNSSNRIYSYTGGTTLDNLNNKIEGAGQIFSNGNLGVVNGASAVIDATGTNNVLNINSIGVTNDNLIESTGAAGLFLQSMTLNQTGGGVLEANGGPINISSNVHIVGGTIEDSANGGLIHSSSTGSLLDGTTAGKPVTIAKGTTVQVDNNENLYIDGAIVDRGVLSLASTTSATDLIVGSGATDQVVTLSGGGILQLSDSGANRIYSNTGATTLDNNDTIQGAGQIFSNGNLGIVNEATGLIDATGTDNVLNINNIDVTNDDLIESTGAAGLFLQSMTLNQTGGGVLEANGGPINISGNVHIIGGTIEDGANGGLIHSSSSGSLLDGTTTGEPVTIAKGTTVQIDNDSNLYIDGDIVDVGEISLASTGDTTDLIVGSGATGATVTLSGGGTVQLSDNNNNRIYSNTGSTTLDNVDNKIQGAGVIASNGNLGVKNEAGGVIDGTSSTAGNDLLITSIDLTNNGLIEGSGSGGLETESMTLNQTGGGVLEADDGTVTIGSDTDIVGGSLTSVDGGLLQSDGARSQLNGASSAVTITAETTLQVHDNTNLYLTTNGGVGSIVNKGTIALDSAGDATDLIVGAGATQGSLDLSGGGVVQLSDSSTNRIYSNTGSTTLNNVDDTIEGAGQIFSNGNLSIVNEAAGVVAATFADTPLAVSSMSFDNLGMAEADNGATLSFTSALTNISTDPNHAGGSVLTGGIYNLVDQTTGGESPGGASTIAISGGGAEEITTLAATVDLAGLPSQLTSNGVSLVNSLLEVGDAGDLNLYYGYNSGYSQNFADPNAVTIDKGGQVSVTGADFSTADLTIASGGYLLASGVFNGAYSIYASVEGPIVNNGLIVADGVEAGAMQPTSYFGGPISGTGSIGLDQDALAEFGGGVGSGQTISFGNDQAPSSTQVAGEATIRIDTTSIDPDGSGPNDFAATIANFALGDAIDLTNLDDVSDYSFNNGALTVFFGSDQMATLKFSDLADGASFRFSSDGDAGTLITAGTSAELANDTGVSATDGVTDDASLTGTADAGATLLFRENGQLLGTTTVGDNGLWSFTPSGLNDGMQTIVVSEGSTESSFQVATVTFALATQAPSVTASQTLSGLTNRTTDIISGSATAEDVAGNGIASVEIVDLDDDVIRDATLGANGAFSATLTGLTDGGHDFDVVTTDIAGNVTSTPLSDVIIATQPPTVSASESVSGTTTQTSDLISETATAENDAYNSITSVVVYDEDTRLGAATYSEGTWLYAANDLKLGVHEFIVVTTDAAGNFTSTLLAPVDVVPGSNPTVNASISAPGLTNQTAETVGETATAVGDNTIVSVEVYDNNVDLGAASFNSQTQTWGFTASGLADGENDFSTVTTDSAGNTTTTALPAVDIATQAPINGLPSESVSGLTNQTSETISVTPKVENVPGNGVASVEIVDTSTDTTTATTLGAGGVYSATLTGLGDGAHVFDIVTTDKAGNQTTTPLAAVDIATQDPVNGSPTESVSGITDKTSETISVTPSAENVPGNSVVSVKIVDTSTDTTTAATRGAGGVYSATLTGLGDGGHVFDIVTTDKAGNQRTTPLAAVDIATQAPLNGSPTESVSGITDKTSETISVTPTVEDVTGNGVASVEIADTSTDTTTAAALGAGGVYSATLTGLGDGAHVFDIVTTDKAGNTTTTALAAVDIATQAPINGSPSESVSGITNKTSETISVTPTVEDVTGNGVASVEIADTSTDTTTAATLGADGLYSATLTGLGDGAHVFDIVTTDKAGNTTTTALPAVDIATQAPVNGSPTESVSGLTRETSETISVTPTVESVPGNGVASVEIVDTSTNTTTSANLGPGGVYSETLSGLGDGAHVFDVVTTDKAGNTATTPLAAVDVATQAPTVDASESVSGTTTQTSDVLTATVTTEDVPGNSIASVLAYDGGTEIGAATLSDGVWSYTASDLELGGHTFSLVAADAAGNSTTTPLAPVDIVSGFGPTVNASISTPGLTNQTSETISETATASAGNTITGVEVFDNGENLGAASFDPQTQTWEFLTPVSDGAHDFSTVTTDSAGNTTTTTLPVVDIATQAPVNGSPTESVSGITNTTSETISVTPTVENVPGNGVASVEIVDTSTDTTTAAALGAGGVYSATLTGLGDGAHVFDIVTTDNAGNVTTTPLVEVDVATQAPINGSPSESVSGITNKTRETISVTPTVEDVAGNGVASVEIVDTSTDATTAATLGADGVYLATLTGLADGAHVFDIVTTDNAGNQTTTPLTAVDVATQAPTMNASESVSGTTTETTDVLTATATAENVPGNSIASVLAYDGETEIGAATLSDGLWTYTASDLELGGHTFSLVATDAAGNSTTTTFAPLDVVSGAGPAVTASISIPGLTNQTSETITETATAVGDNTIVSVEVLDNGEDLGAASFNSDTQTWSFTASGLTDGAHNFSTVTTDSADNTTTTTLPVVNIATVAPLNSSASESVSGITNETNETISVTPTVEDVTGNGVASVEIVDTSTDTTTAAALGADGVYSAMVTDIGDGAHVFDIVTTDNAGNVTTTPLVEVDVATQAPVNGSPSESVSGITNKTSETISVTPSAEDVAGNGVASVEIVDTSTDATTAAALGADGVYSATLTGLGDGAHVFDIVTTDNAGNVTTTPLVEVDVATQAPINGAPSESVSGITNKTSETISVTPTVEDVAGNGVASVEIVDTSTDATTAATLGADGVYSATLTGLADGAHVFDIVTTDNAGNQTTTPLTAVDIATQAPTMNASESVSGTTTETTDVLTATATAENVPGNSIASVLAYDGETEIGAATLSDGLWTYTASDLELGGHTFSLVATDAAGNSKKTTFAPLDVVSGAGPAVNASISIPGLTNQTSETITETATAVGDNTIVSVEVLDNGEDLGAASFNSDTQTWSFTASGLTDGENDFSTVTTDSADNTTTTTLPVVDIATQAAVNGSPSESLSGITNQTSETISVTPTVEDVAGNGVASVEIVDTSTDATTAATLGAGGVYSATLTGLADGAHVFDIVTTDNAGNQTTTPLTAVDIATKAPTMNASESVSGTTTQTTDVLTATVTAEDVPGDSIASVVAYDDETQIGAATLSDGVWSYTADLALGGHTLSLVATDAAGNSTTTILAPVHVVSGAGPTVNASISAPGLTNQTSETISETATASAGNTIASVEVFDNSEDLGAASFNANTQIWSFTANDLGDGAHDFSTVTTDNDDNATTTTLAEVDIATQTPVNGSPSETVSGLTNQTSETISVTPTVENAPGNGVASVEIVDTSTDTTTAATLGAGGVYSATLTGLSDGAHVFDIVTTDNAGNTTTTPLAEVDIATQAPVDGSPSESVSGITNTTSETISVTPTVEDVPGNGVASVDIVDTSTDTTTAATLGAGGVYSATLTGLGDGAHVFDIVTTDSADNTTTTTLAALDIATALPTVTASQTLGRLTNENQDTVTETATAEAVGPNAIESVEIYDSATDLGAATLSGGLWTFTTGILPDGAHDLTTLTTDAAGNQTTTTLPVIHVGTNPPRVKASESVSGLTNQSSITVTETAIAEQVAFNAIESVEVYDGATALGAATLAGGTWTFATPTLADGVHHLRTVTTDAAGNSATKALAAVDVATAPPTVTVYQTLGRLTNQTQDTITETATAEAVGPDAIESVEVYDGADALGAASQSGSVWAFTTGLLSDGAHHLTTLTTDAAGNQTTTTLPVAHVGTSPPRVKASESVSGLTNQSNVTITETAIAEQVAFNTIQSVEVYDGATALGAATLAAGVWTFTTPTLADGVHYLHTVTTDAAGNTKNKALAAVDVATTPPSVTASQNLSGLTNETQDTITETATAEPVGPNAIASVNVFDGSTALGAATFSDGAWTFTTQPLAFGGHDLSTVTTDATGNTTTTLLAPINVEPPAPNVSIALIDDTSDGLDITSDDALSGGGDPGATVQITLDGSPVAQTVTADGDGNWTFTPAGLSEGPHTIVAGETNGGGTGSATLNFTYVTTPPSVSIATPSGAVAFPSETIDGAGEAGTTVQLFDGSQPLGGTVDVGANGVWIDTVTLTDAGAHTITASDTDAANNVDVSSAITLFLDNQIVVQSDQTQLSSATGNDHIIVDAANATVTALGGDNTVSLTSAGGGSQFHIIDGGGGANTLDLSGTSGGAIVDLGAQLATGPEIGTNDVFNFQNIIGGAGPETLTLNTAPGGGTGPTSGGAGTPTLDATSGGGFIEAGSGADIMTGSPIGSAFVFLSAFGNDTITNFNVSGSTHDVFEVSQSLFANWSAIDAALSDTAAGAELVLNPAETVTFTGVTKAALEANSTADFRFV